MNLLLLFLCVGSAAYSSHWGYGEDNGPDTWPETCLEGVRQSPIDIRASDVIPAYMPKILFTNYDKTGPVKIRNNGHSGELKLSAAPDREVVNLQPLLTQCAITVEGFENWGENEPFIEEGGLNYRYRLDSFHFHWSQNYFGSEHAIGGLHYTAELHLVHYRDDLTESQAVATPGGIVVLGVFLLVGNDATPIAAVSSALEDVMYPGNSTSIENFCLKSLLPENTDSFFRYDGSLTVPGCYEVVTWTIFAEPTTLTPLQMKEFQKVHSDEETKLEHNCRPVQPLNGRKIMFRISKSKEVYDNRISGSEAFSILMTVLTCLFLARSFS